MNQRRNILPALIWAMVALTVVLLCAPAFGQTTKPIEAPFIVGVFQQPPESFDKWTARGVNTFVGHTDNGGRMTKAEWESAIISRRGNFITYPGADVAIEAKQPGRVGFSQLDESDLSNHVGKPGNTPAEHKAVYDRCRATGLPTYINLAAFDNEFYDGFPKPAKTDGSKWGHRAASGGWMANADVICTDFYLWTNNRGGRFDVWERLIDRMVGWSDGKPFILYIETCTQGKNLPYTADQFESEVWKGVDYAKAKGYRVKGVIYFSHKVYPGWTSFDITPDDIAARMPIVNSKLVEMFGKPGVPVTPPTTRPAADPELAAVRAEVSQLRAQQAEQAAFIAWLKKGPATQPSTTQPTTTQPTTQPGQP